MSHALSMLATLQSDDWIKCTDSHAAWLLRLSSRPPVDIVIPVFGGTERVAELLSSDALWEGVRQVIVVDDCSPDPALGVLLRETRSRHGNLVEIRNRRNFGFVISVNRGLRLAEDADVVVLNSDAVVGGSWLSRLQVSAYAFERVATVSPLSNAAGFFSLPVPRQDNSPPPGIDAETSCIVLSMITPKIHEETVATSGFCWYLRRDAREEIGLLDERLYYRGYAEDTDFCRRASVAGFKNLCSLQTFVVHGRGKSFGGEKERLKKVNGAMLQALDPTFLDDLRAYEAGSAVPVLAAAFGAIINAGGGKTIRDEIGMPKYCRIVESHSRETAPAWLELAPSDDVLNIRLRDAAVSLSVPAERLNDFLVYLNFRFGIQEVDDRIDA